MRKKLYPVLKAAKQEKRTAFFKVERLIIDGRFTAALKQVLSRSTGI